MIRRLTTTMKTMLGATALFLAMTTAAEAQTKAVPATPAEKPAKAPAKQDRTAEGATKVTGLMKAQLALNDLQYTKVLEINRTYLVKAKDANAASVVGQERAKRMKAIADEREAKLKSVLTEDQFKKYASGRAQNMKELRGFTASN